MDTVFTIIELVITIATIVVIFQTHALATSILNKLYEMERKEKEREKQIEERN